MGIFDRTADGIERRNVGAVYAAEIEKLRKRIQEHESTLASLKTQAKLHDTHIARIDEQLAELARTMEAALAEDDADTALVLGSRRDDIEARRQTEVVKRDTVQAHLTEAQRLLSTLEEQKKELEKERHAAPAKKAVAEARIAIEEERTGLGDSATARSLGSVRDKVGELNRTAFDGYLDSEGNPITGKQRALSKKAAEDKAREQLEQLKKDLGQDD